MRLQVLSARAKRPMVSLPRGKSCRDLEAKPARCAGQDRRRCSAAVGLRAPPGGWSIGLLDGPRPAGNHESSAHGCARGPGLRPDGVSARAGARNRPTRPVPPAPSARPQAQAHSGAAPGCSDTHSAAATYQGRSRPLAVAKPLGPGHPAVAPRPSSGASGRLDPGRVHAGLSTQLASGTGAPTLSADLAHHDGMLARSPSTGSPGGSSPRTLIRCTSGSTCRCCGTWASPGGG